MEEERRLEAILDMIAKLASLDFSTDLPISEKQDMIDAISLGLNMLGEELNTQVVARVHMDELNEKLEKFAYTTAHDLKSPLNSQSGLLNLLEYSIDLDKNPEIKEIIAKLKSMNERMKSLVLGILEYSKSNTLQINLEPVELNNLVQEVMESDGILDKANVSIPSNLPNVMLNRTAGIQVFRNLLDNAVKYCDKSPCEIHICYRELEDKYEFSVSDNGPGISPDYHQKIFNVFEQEKINPKAEGLGIGLATVKNIIEGAGGNIHLESEQGKGTKFIFTLRKA